MVQQLRYQEAVRSVRDRVLAVTGSLWAGLGSYRDADIDRLVARVVPLVVAGQIQTANLTAAYFRTVLGVAAVVDPDLVTTGRGVAAAEVYRRPATTAYTALSQGKPVSVALSMGAARLASLVSMDMQMSKVRQAQSSMTAGGVEFYRRSLTGKENCAMCVIASTQRYRSGDLLPIHPGCDCAVDVLSGPQSLVLDQELLDATHAAIDTKLYGERSARDLGLGKVSSKGKPLSDYTDLIVSRTHGEYGPTLAWRSDKFTSAADIAALN